MKTTFFAIFSAAFLLIQTLSAAYIDILPSSQPFANLLLAEKTPDFSPPKDLSGPVFPIEDVVGKPGPATDKFISEFISMFATLGLIISLILIVAWFLKRMVNSQHQQGNESSLVKVIERRSISPKTAIYLLEVEGKTLIIAESINGVIRLTDYDTVDEEKQKNSPFAKILEQGKK